MPEALATSKRKFYKLLDNLSAPPPPIKAVSSSVLAAHSSVATTVEPTTKRLRPSTSSSTLSAIRARNASNASLASTSSVIVVAPPKEPPNFSPWSHETFLGRLRTFASVSLWHPKPEAVNEVEWARRGWECVDTNTVGCRGGCGKRVLVKIEPALHRVRSRNVEADKNVTEDGVEKQAGEDEVEDDDEDFDEAFEQGLVEKYKALIIEGHSDSCLWRRTGCKNDIYRLHIVRSAIWQAELKENHTSLMAISTDIASVQLKAQGSEPKTKKLLADLPSRLFAATQTEGAPETDSNLQVQALDIALCGWHGTTEAGTALLSCNACFQRIGLWMYQPDYKRRHMRSVTEEEADTDEDANDHSLDLVEMHREHCPWRNGDSQCAAGDYAGWPAAQIMRRVVARYADEQRRRSRDRGPIAVVDTSADAGQATLGASAAEHPNATIDDEHGSPAPERGREDIEKMDKERVTKLRRLRTILGLKRKAPAAA